MEINYTTPNRRVLNCSKCLRRMTFLIEGLRKGKCDTIAVALRRNMIGYTPGLAPAAIKILGANQLYAPVKGLVHDTNDLSILIKNLKVVANDTETGDVPTTVVLEIDRTYTNESIKFGDFKLASGQANIEMAVLNPDKVLTYVGGENVPVNIKVLLQLGVGYSAYNVTNKVEDFPEEFTDCIPVDSLYSPVVDVVYEVKKQTPTKETDSLLLTVETDGSISPIDAVDFAAKTMIADGQMISSLFDLELSPQEVMLNVAKADTEAARPNVISENSEIEVLGLPTDLYDMLKDAHINHIKDMKVNKELMAKKDEIKMFFEKAGLTLEEVEE